MSKLEWDKTGEKYWHAGVSQVVLFPMKADGTYDNGVAWNGVTAVNESPDGAEANDFYADNIKYASLRSAENHKGSISAYQYPDEWNACDGKLVAADGVYIGEQARNAFGLVYRTEYGNDTGTTSDDGYILHFLWNATVNPTEKNHETINENPDLAEFDWDYECLPTPITSIAGAKPCSTMEVNSKKLDAAKLKTILDQVYGTDQAEPTLPTPDQLIATVTKP